MFLNGELVMKSRDFLYMVELRKYFGIPLESGGTLAVSRDTIEAMFKKGLKKSFLLGKVIVFKTDLETYLNMVRENGSSKRSAE